MIVEFFGPPCVGKTTLANAFAAELQNRGYNVRLISSFRPAEVAAVSPSRSGPAVDALQRLSRAATEMTHLLLNKSIQVDDARVTHALLQLMPPKSVIWTPRMHQYIARLASNWRAASADVRITIFDQGFVQVVYSLATLARKWSQGQIEQAIGMIPMPDVLARLAAPNEVLISRLSERQRGHGRLERLLEVSPEANMASLPIFEVLDHILRRRSIPLVQIEPDGDQRCGMLFREIEGRFEKSEKPELLPVTA